uniref:Glycine-rich cell wall structural protein-like n=1 Tax=Ciona intestinalis TaxID=7719 RepID=H2Y0M1_CIOIN|nr:glycine-rich cell wall structural protein-like [Ciona intestinalis]|eukprot:XP_026693972.1 glycine-rich cell wall structural protein-like [Ciona intestinalis]
MRCIAILLLVALFVMYVEATVQAKNNNNHWGHGNERGHGDGHGGHGHWGGKGYWGHGGHGKWGHGGHGHNNWHH